MRIIFSRKGFDSSFGGGPSPILDGKAYSLPIPTMMPSPTTFGDLASPFPELVTDLTCGRHGASSACHLDPDIEPTVLGGLRPLGWRGALGQVSAAQSHLRNQGIVENDLFLFWGLFRAVHRGSDGRWDYYGPRMHLLYGWLQIESIVDLGPDGSHVLTQYPWLSLHPHARAGWPTSNTMYIARRKLQLAERELSISGSGWFKKPLQLTEADAACPSDWSAPLWLDPTQGGTGLSYHRVERWIASGRIRIVARGQEFVANAEARTDTNRQK